MPRRTLAQIALLVVGFIVWGYGQRADDQRAIWTGIACFAAAVLLRLFRSRIDRRPDDVE